MIFRFGPVGLLGVALVTGVPCAIVLLARRIPLRRAIVVSIFAAYVPTLLAIVLVEGSHFGIPGEIYSLRESLNLVPFRTIIEFTRPDHSAQAVRQLVGNVAMFVPLGVLLPAMNARFRRIKPLLTTALLASVAIEFAQLALLVSKIAVRSVDIDDVILNTLGAAIGYGIWCMFSHHGRRLAANAQTVPQDAD